MKKSALLSLLFLSYFISSAQDDKSTLRTTVTFQTGDIVSSTTARVKDGAYTLAATPYDDNLLAVYNAEGGALKELVFVQEGIAYVKFNETNGTIKRGDFVTSSTVAGAAMKATKSGMVLGVALKDSNNTTKKGLLKIRVLVHYQKL